MYFVVINSLFETTSHMNFSFFFQFRRTKRVNMKDLLYLMEQEPETKKSHLLYKMYLKWSATTEEVSSSYRCLLVPKDHHYPTIILSRYWRSVPAKRDHPWGWYAQDLDDLAHTDGYWYCMDGFGGLTSLQGIIRPVHIILQDLSDIEHAAPSERKPCSSALYSSNMEGCCRIDIIQCNLWHVIALAPTRLQIFQQSQLHWTFLLGFSILSYL